jgi:hypothetical protein
MLLLGSSVPLVGRSERVSIEGASQVTTKHYGTHHACMWISLWMKLWDTLISVTTCPLDTPLCPEVVLSGRLALAAGEQPGAPTLRP